MDNSLQPPGSLFPHLLSPLKVGTTELRNRLVMGSMHTRLEHAPEPIARLTAFYVERARGGVALIVTGGISPNQEGRMEDDAPVLASPGDAVTLRPLVAAVHDAGAKILLQILHAGRYAKHALNVGVSAIRSPINTIAPRPLTAHDIERTLDDYVRCAELAGAAGFDGVEIMGSEGYLINQFTALRTNDRSDEWGGAVAQRVRFPVAVVQRIRAALGRNFLIMYRISAIDLVDGGATADDIDFLAQAVEKAGADILSTGIGWHEARVPTIAYTVPRGAWRFATARLKRAVNIPVVASNRINTPELAEEILAGGEADLVSMARPLLADPEFLSKAKAGRAEEINKCIACNQACLDFIFSNRIATCLVNPRAGREAEFISSATTTPRKIAVVGAGPAGLSFATTAAARGHHVTLFEQAAVIGGQLNLARNVPGKQEFAELIGYFAARLRATGVNLRLGAAATPVTLAAGGYDRLVIAAGVSPRAPAIPGIHHAKVAYYPDILSGKSVAGKTVAIIGGGGIGFDVAEYLTHATTGAPDMPAFYAEWGIDTLINAPGGIQPLQAPVAARTVFILQRSSNKPGARLGVSTGWILRASLKQRRVSMVAGCTYRKIDDDGLHYTADGRDHLIPADTVVICAGQEPAVAAFASPQPAATPIDFIGGAQSALQLDALRAIEQGMRLGLAC